MLVEGVEGGPFVDSNPAWNGLDFIFWQHHRMELDVPTLARVGLVIPPLDESPICQMLWERQKTESEGKGNN